MLELEGGRAKFFKGPWHAWRKEKAARELALGRAIERQQAEIERLERFVTRFRAGTRARQAQSRAKKLARMDRLQRGPADTAGLEFSFKPPERSGRVVFEFEDGNVEVGGRVLLDDVELWLERGEHVSLVGPNGAGKTTLIETLAGRRELADPHNGADTSAGAAALPVVTGKLRTGHNVKLGFLSQHAEELSAGSARTVLEATTHLTKLTPNNARGLLGRFLFSGEDAEKPLEVLSGGERRRLSLAILVQSGANVLILDEPTNHLDLESREALEQALNEFTGSLLLVSHDRALLDAVGKRTVAIEDAGLHSYIGGWPEYVRAREERARDEAAKPPKPGTKEPKPRARSAGTPPQSTNSKEQQRLEREIEAAEASLKALEEELADPAAWSTPQRSASGDRPPPAGQGRGRRAVPPLGADRRLARRLRDRRRAAEDRAAVLLGGLERGRVRVDAGSADPDADAAVRSGLELRIGEVRNAVRTHAARHRERLRLRLGRLSRRRMTAVRKVRLAALDRRLERRPVHLNSVHRRAARALLDLKVDPAAARIREVGDPVRAHALGELERLAVAGGGVLGRRRPGAGIRARGAAACGQRDRCPRETEQDHVSHCYLLSCGSTVVRDRRLRHGNEGCYVCVTTAPPRSRPTRGHKWPRATL